MGRYAISMCIVCPLISPRVAFRAVVVFFGCLWFTLADRKQPVQSVVELSRFNCLKFGMSIHLLLTYCSICSKLGWPRRQCHVWRVFLSITSFDP